MCFQSWLVPPFSSGTLPRPANTRPQTWQLTSRSQVYGEAKDGQYGSMKDGGTLLAMAARLLLMLHGALAEQVVLRVIHGCIHVYTHAHLPLAPTQVAMEARENLRQVEPENGAEGDEALPEEARPRHPDTPTPRRTLS